MESVASGDDVQSIASNLSEQPRRSNQGVPVSTVSELRVTLEGSERVVAAGTTARDVLDREGTMIAARVNGEPRDLAHELRDGDEIEPISISSDDGRAILRHSTAHVLAQAVQELFPAARLGIGPPVDNGFYYDFDVPEPFTPDDLKRIEKRMREIVKQGQRFSRRVVTDAAARAELAAEPYKLELIGLKGEASGGGIEPSTPRPANGAGATCAAARTCPPPASFRRSS